MSRKKPISYSFWGGSPSKGSGRITLDWIDESLKPIVEELWSRGYSTTCSCEGGPNHPAAAGWVFLRGPLSKKDREEIRRLVKKHTDIPFVLSKRGLLIFEGPLDYPYDVEEVKKGFWQDDLQCDSWHTYYMLQRFGKDKDEDEPEGLSEPGFWDEDSDEHYRMSN